MKRYDGLWEQVIAWENLLLAARKARRGKRGRAEVTHFEFQREAELLRLQAELSGGTYQPGAFRSHWIVRPKRRLISAAPYRDRVVHHALMNVLEPILDRHFHPHSYACRHGKGTHAAADRLQHLLRRFRFFVQCDIRKYFPSIDHYLTSHLGLRGYVRYCDDFVLRHDDRAALSELLVAVRDWLSHARLRLKRSSPPVTPVQAGLTFVGYRIWRTHRLLRKQNIRQFRRRVRWMRRAYARGSVEWSAIKPRLDSWMGHARQADSERLLRRISCEWTFVRVPSVP
jgi:RNA-directed DNA polymerase